MSNEDIADTLFVDEIDMAILATQNELFKLIGVTDGDPRYSDVLLIADWHTRKLKEAVIKEIKLFRDATVGYIGPNDFSVQMIDARIAEIEKEATK